MTLMSFTKLASAASLLGFAAADSPWFCHSNDCPIFSNSSVGGTEVCHVMVWGKGGCSNKLF
jgi:hypothetical protein